MHAIDLPNGGGLSELILGGHEYLPDGRSRAFNEDMARAVTPGVVFPGFGGPGRLAVLRRALDAGVRAFDVTIDSEKEALGRNLRQLGVRDATVQTRPEGMLYGYDPANRKLVTPGLLRAEVRRIIDMMQVPRIDILNIGILRDALDADAAYLSRLADILDGLKQEGLIGHAAADSFSGARCYLAMIACGAFDSININFNLADDRALDEVIPAARARGMRVVAREIYLKGELFRIARDLGLPAAQAARAAYKWVLSQPGIDACILGAQDELQLQASLDALASRRLDSDDLDTLDRLFAAPALRTLRENNRARFLL